MATKALMYNKYVVYGVRERKVSGGYSIEKVSRGQRPQYCTLYGVDADGCEIAIADFKRRSDAEALKKELNRLLRFYQKVN
jgi:hypothetical protein